MLSSLTRVFALGRKFYLFWRFHTKITKSGTGIWGRSVGFCGHKQSHVRVDIISVESLECGLWVGECCYENTAACTVSVFTAASDLAIFFASIIDSLLGTNRNISKLCLLAGILPVIMS